MEVIKRHVYEQIPIDIAIGSRDFSSRINIKDGVCVGVKYIDFDETKRPNRIDVNVESADGDALIGKTDYRDYINKGGDYFGNFKPCRFKTNADLLINVSSLENIATAAMSGTLVFMIEQPCNI